MAHSLVQNTLKYSDFDDITSKTTIAFHGTKSLELSCNLLDNHVSISYQVWNNGKMVKNFFSRCLAIDFYNTI